MKKVITVCLCGLLLAACAAAPASAVPSSQPQSTPPSVQAETAGGGNLRFSKGAGVHGDEQGMYFSMLITWNRATVCYADYATRQIVALCGEPNCAHDSEACTAWVECPPNKPEVAPVGQQLLFLYHGSPGIADLYGKASLPRLELRTRTGQFVRELAAFENGTRFAEEYAVDDKAVYLMLEQVSGETTRITKTLVRVSLADGSRSELVSFELESGENCFLVGVCGERFVMKRIKADASAPDPVKSQQHELFLVDKLGKSEPPFKSWVQDAGQQAGVDGRIFYLEKGELTCIDPERQTDVCAQSDIFEPGMVNFSICTEPWLLLSSLVHRSVAYDAPIYYAVDLQTGEVRELTAVTALGQDSQFMFLGAGSEELFGSYFDEQGVQQYASISRQDLWSGKANWQVFTQSVT